jgi:hypothetical protein
MRSWIIAAALALTATPALAQDAAPAPLPDGAIAVTADQSGASIDASVGAAVAIQLQRNASVGTNWTVASKPDFLGDPGTLTGPTRVSTRPILGAPSWQVFVFPVSDAGSGEVTLEKKDRTGAVVETFTVTVNAQ